MFDFVRKHTKLMMILMFLIVFPAFVLVGVDGFSRITAGGPTAAVVGNQTIDEAEWDAAHKREVERMRAQMPTIDIKLLDTPEMRYATLERLVRERVMALAAQDARLVTSDARLARELQQNPTIASLRKPDGTMDMDRYRQLAAQQGLTPEGFESSLRKEISERQLETGITQTAIAPAALSQTALNAFYERREVQLTRFNAADYTAKVQPTEADIEAYYKANPKQFQAPEMATVEYVVLDLESVKKTITLNESDVKTYYEQNASRLSGKEERRASHILITAAKDASDSDKQKAMARATELLEQLRKKPGSFADLATQHSQDPGSAARGGDLEYFGRGAMVKPFEDTAFTLKKDEISDVVESDFGYHIIKVTDIKGPKIKSFEELRAGIEADLKGQQARQKYAEAADVFTNMVYEQPDSLAPTAERLKLEVQTASRVLRQPGPTTAGLFANPKLLGALFTPESVDKKRNTEAIEIAPSQLVAARVVEHSPARTLPLAEVSDQAKARLVASRAAEMAKKEGTDKLAQWKQSDPTALPATVVVSREGAPTVPTPVQDAVLRANTSQLPAWVGVDLGAQGYAVARIGKVLTRPAPAQQQADRERQQFAQLMANAESQAFYQLLSQRLKVEIKAKRPARTSTEPAAE